MLQISSPKPPPSLLFFTIAIFMNRKFYSRLALRSIQIFAWLKTEYTVEIRCYRIRVGANKRVSQILEGYLMKNSAVVPQPWGSFKLPPSRLWLVCRSELWFDGGRRIASGLPHTSRYSRRGWAVRLRVLGGLGQLEKPKRPSPTRSSFHRISSSSLVTKFLAGAALKPRTPVACGLIPRRLRTSGKDAVRHA